MIHVYIYTCDYLYLSIYIYMYYICISNYLPAGGAAASHPEQE